MTNTPENINTIIDAAEAAYWEASKAFPERGYATKEEQYSDAVALGNQAQAILHLRAARAGMQAAATIFRHKESA